MPYLNNEVARAFIPDLLKERLRQLKGLGAITDEADFIHKLVEAYGLKYASELLNAVLGRTWGPVARPWGSEADEIRRFIDEHYIKPARQAGKSTISVNAGDVHDAMLAQGLIRAGNVPNVCQVMQGRKLQTQCNVSISQQQGANPGRSYTVTYKL